MYRTAPLAILALACFSVSACASASIGDAPADSPDGGVEVETPDAAPQDTPDAGPQTVTLQASTTNTIEPDNSVSCNSNDPDFFHAENRYFRKYSLPDLGITSDLVVTSVDIGVQEALSLTGTQPVRLSLYTLEGNFLMANMTPLGARNLDVADQTLQVMTVPIDDVVAPAGSTLVVEVFTPDGQADSNRFFIGSNKGTETDPSYIVAPSTGCDISEPTALSDLGIPGLQMSIVLNVNGEHTSAP
jgi:hypothetical protein